MIVILLQFWLFVLVIRSFRFRFIGIRAFIFDDIRFHYYFDVESIRKQLS